MLSQSNLCIPSQTAERQQLEMKTVKSSAFNQQWGNFEVFILPLTSSKDAPFTSLSVTIIKSGSMIKPRRSTEEAHKSEISCMAFQILAWFKVFQSKKISILRLELELDFGEGWGHCSGVSCDDDSYGQEL